MVEQRTRPLRLPRLPHTLGHRFLLALLLLFTVKQVITALVFPPFTGHDEVAHYAYIQVVATEQRLPVIPDLAAFRAQVEASRAATRMLPPVADLPGDYLPNELYPYCAYVLDWQWCDQPTWAINPPHVVTWLNAYYPWGWQYTANHPPVYYLLMAPVYRATEGMSPATQQYLLRLAAIPFGLLVVLLAYLTAATLFRRDAFLSITTAAFVAFQPQVAYEAAMVNNDIAGIAAVSLIVYLTVRGLRDGFPRRQLALLGLAIGLGLLTKSTTAIALPGVALALALGAGARNVRVWLGNGALIAGVAACLAWPWYLHLWQTYGNLSGLPQIERLQFRWTYPPGQRPSVADLLFNAEFALMRWRETWGLFGWRLIPLDGTLLLAIGLACLIGVAGLARYVASLLGRRRPADGSIHAPERWQLVGLGALLVTCVSAYAAVIQFGLTFRLTQARYFFPAIVPVALLLLLGWRVLLPERALRYAQAAIVLGLILLHVAIYTQYVMPYWHLAS